jgi:integrase
MIWCSPRAWAPYWTRGTSAVRFRKITAAAGLDPAEWTPRELRHSFVSLLSDAGVPVEKIARLVGHTGTATTELVYRKQIRPVVAGGAAVMDQLFPRRNGDAELLT